ncbi:hypothetical protein BEP19_08140 [Ammoniphilus oxalaticus]|uniref:Probable endopeptidase p60 n=1 Tax=Ammoniphilus oxalaticus TaxID=66863 RepID=A0A419SJZ5_9BACL|nr:NlpC/P60 family protein [Ammoniphilus oxalaticus]RKD24354.1 hypothetical protein BEP19_08140 [Ammoniphilus oxalaticus]
MKKIAGLLLSTFLIAGVAQANPNTYIVKQGDTLYEIARQHSASVEQIKQWNGLATDQIRIGQPLALAQGATLANAGQTAVGSNRVSSGQAKATIQADRLNVREKGDLSGQVIGSFSRGVVVDVLQRGPQWSLVESGGLKGYVSNDFLQAGAGTSVTTVSRSGNPFESRLQNVVRPLVGTPYKLGGTSPAGFDCSGFTAHVMGQFGVKLPRISEDQFHVGVAVDRANLQPGDLLFFDSYGSGKITHVGIYVGNNRIAHAASRSVSIDDATWYFNNYRYYGAKRVLR